jgi:predicted nucleotidyltransferase
MSTTRVRSKKEVYSAIKAHGRSIRALGVYRLGLFGSFRTGRVRASSDVDFVVEFLPEKKTFDNLMDLSFLLEGILGRSVELVTPQSLSSTMLPHIVNQAEDVAF